LSNDGKLLSAGAVSMSASNRINNDNGGEILTAGALTLNAPQIDNSDSATIESQTTANIMGAQLNNSGSLQANELKAISSTIHNLSTGRINAGHVSLYTTDTLTNDGLIDGGTTELRSEQNIINNNKIYGGDFTGSGGILISSPQLTNNANAVISSRSQMRIGAQNVD
jgi:filamentous hemagglutinin